MVQSKFNSGVKMLAYPLKPNIFDSHPLEMLIFWATFFFYKNFFELLIKKKKKKRQGKLFPKRQPLFGLSGKTKNGNPFLDHTKDQLQLH